MSKKQKLLVDAGFTLIGAAVVAALLTAGISAAAPQGSSATMGARMDALPPIDIEVNTGTETLETVFQRLTAALDVKPVNVGLVTRATARLMSSFSNEPVALHQLYQVATVLTSSGELDAAEALLATFATAAPQRTDAWALLGHVQLVKGKYSDAIGAMRRAEADGADHFNTIRMALVYELMGNIPSASAAMDRAFARAPELHDLQLRRAMLWIYTDTTRAVTELQRFLKNHEGLETQIRTGVWEEGVAARQLAVSLGGERRVGDLMSVATRFVTAGASPFVLSIASLLDREAPGHPGADVLRGSFYAQMHMMDFARASYELAASKVNATTDEATAYAAALGAVDVNIKMGDGKRATSVLKALPAQSDRGWYSLLQARLLTQTGNVEGANAVLEQCGKNDHLQPHWKKLCEETLRGTNIPLKSTESRT